MRAYAKFVESEMGVQYCTLNLRLLVVHSFDQEFVTGPILHTLEFWIERAIQRYKKWIKDRVVKDPDIFLGQAYLLDLALRYESTRTRSVEEFFETAEVRTSADRKDDTTLFAHFLDNGAGLGLSALVLEALDAFERLYPLKPLKCLRRLHRSKRLYPLKCLKLLRRLQGLKRSKHTSARSIRCS